MSMLVRNQIDVLSVVSLTALLEWRVEKIGDERNRENGEGAEEKRDAKSEEKRESRGRGRREERCQKLKRWDGRDERDHRVLSLMLSSRFSCSSCCLLLQRRCSFTLPSGSCWRCDNAILNTISWTWGSPTLPPRCVPVLCIIALLLFLSFSFSHGGKHVYVADIDMVGVHRREAR